MSMKGGSGLDCYRNLFVPVEGGKVPFSSKYASFCLLISIFSATDDQKTNGGCRFDL